MLAVEAITKMREVIFQTLGRMFGVTGLQAIVESTGGHPIFWDLEALLQH